MRVFVTGASGFIGSAIVRELVGAGHQVLGMVRSDAGAQSVVAAGAEVHRGDLEDLESIRQGARRADAVIHTAFIHDFSKFQANCEIDRRVIETLGAVLAGSDRPLIVTSGTGIGISAPGELASENNGAERSITQNPRIATELATAAVAAKGVRVSVMRLPPSVHGRDRQGLVSPLIEVARQKGVSAYIGEGGNRWAAVHRLDAAHAFVRALEKGAAHPHYHAVAEEGVSLRDIAEAIGRGLKVPVVSQSPAEAAQHFGWLGAFVGADVPASSALTREWLGWRPVQIGLLADLEQAAQFES